MTLCPEPHTLGLAAIFLSMMECVGVYYKPWFSAGDGGPEDMHLANCVSRPRLLWEEIFLFIIPALNLAMFSCGGSGVLCSRAEPLQGV